ncbi:type IV pili methyl-accepting chemotaxis transducer N-terminal domain-containing protein [Jeongeupia naejangsanensis]|uniref:Type IV pili methyl-accepting chemotaxis transducer N-terminal domain-containing protein n=1 Tax=Jeongeupia naejangsanensis TaxID=613195 RepID=A0ABS2BP88_9NEIS|nr:type IV pili methyl-accepting chemotaxis transducer N-terminal domain-containing protein [Jeongeupia naejangsanensis]MBM3117437.1 type IV pili methyl-accepting chemotaxis transducer N-terminal domain-containing protein [Jeongeupia naejangsanensis]
MIKTTTKARPASRARRAGACLAMILAGCAFGAQAGAVRTQDINNAAQLRMLAQRTAKLSLQIRLGVRTADATGKLGESIRQFDSLLGQLQKVGSDDPTLERALDAVAYNWETLKTQLSERDPDRINQASEELTMTILRATRTLESHAPNETGKLVSLAVQENTLSQRMAKLYFLSQLGRQTRPEVEVTRTRFAAVFKQLTDAPGNTPRATSLLALAKDQWFFYEQALKAPPGKDKVYLENVATTSERISEMMEAVTTHYTRQNGTSRQP